VSLATSSSNVYGGEKIDGECKSCYDEDTLFLTGLRSAVSRVVIFIVNCSCCSSFFISDPLNAELNPICHLPALLGAQRILHISRIRVKIFICSVTAVFVKLKCRRNLKY